MKHINIFKILISIKLIIFCFIIGACGKADDTPISLNLNSTKDVAEVTARLQVVKEKIYPENPDKADSEDKERLKKKIDEILKEYGIDKRDEKIKFAKIVQKFSYQKLFNQYLQDFIIIYRKK